MSICAWNNEKCAGIVGATISCYFRRRCFGNLPKIFVYLEYAAFAAI